MFGIYLSFKITYSQILQDMLLLIKQQTQILQERNKICLVSKIRHSAYRNYTGVANSHSFARQQLHLTPHQLLNTILGPLPIRKKNK